MKKPKKTKREITVGFAYERVAYIEVEASSRKKAIDLALEEHVTKTRVGLCHQCSSEMYQENEIVRMYVEDRDGLAEYDSSGKFVRWHIKPKKEKEKEK